MDRIKSSILFILLLAILITAAVLACSGYYRIGILLILVVQVAVLYKFVLDT